MANTITYKGVQREISSLTDLELQYALNSRKGNIKRLENLSSRTPEQEVELLERRTERDSLQTAYDSRGLGSTATPPPTPGATTAASSVVAANPRNKKEAVAALANAKTKHNDAVIARDKAQEKFSALETLANTQSNIETEETKLAADQRDLTKLNGIASRRFLWFKHNRIIRNIIPKYKREYNDDLATLAAITKNPDIKLNSKNLRDAIQGVNNNVQTHTTEIRRLKTLKADQITAANDLGITVALTTKAEIEAAKNTAHSELNLAKTTANEWEAEVTKLEGMQSQFKGTGFVKKAALTGLVGVLGFGALYATSALFPATFATSAASFASAAVLPFGLAAFSVGAVAYGISKFAPSMKDSKDSAVKWLKRGFVAAAAGAALLIPVSTNANNIMNYAVLGNPARAAHISQLDETMANGWNNFTDYLGTFTAEAEEAQETEAQAEAAPEAHDEAPATPPPSETVLTPDAQGAAPAGDEPPAPPAADEAAPTAAVEAPQLADPAQAETAPVVVEAEPAQPPAPDDDIAVTAQAAAPNADATVVAEIAAPDAPDAETAPVVAQTTPDDAPTINPHPDIVTPDAPDADATVVAEIVAPDAPDDAAPVVAEIAAPDAPDADAPTAANTTTTNLFADAAQTLPQPAPTGDGLSFGTTPADPQAASIQTVSQDQDTSDPNQEPVTEILNAEMLLNGIRGDDRGFIDSAITAAEKSGNVDGGLINIVNNIVNNNGFLATGKGSVQAVEAYCTIINEGITTDGILLPEKHEEALTALLEQIRDGQYLSMSAQDIAAQDQNAKADALTCMADAKGNFEASANPNQVAASGQAPETSRRPVARPVVPS